MQPGSRIAHFEVLSLIGAGGMGEVYRARDSRLGRDVAIKVLPAEFASDAKRLRRFEHEARAVGALNHPNILAVYDIGAHGDASYLVTELLEGETLRACLHRGALSPRKAMECAVQIAEGLAAAHAKGIVHRDLKPGNVFVTDDGHIKILDFGLAKAVASSAEERASAAFRDTLTAEGTVVGTAAYMSPEQVKGLPVDQRSDLFSLGVVLYEMVTGKQAFGRDSTAETMAAILKEEPPDPSSVSAVVPPALSRAIAHCLEKRPDERFQSARDLIFELKAILADTTGGKTAPMLKRRRTRVALVVAATVAVVGVVAGIWRLLRPERPLRAANFQLLSTFPGSHRWPTFSPDGRMIAFVSDADGSPQIWVKNLAGGDPIRITSGKLNPSHPSWSPRNDQIVFSAGTGLSSTGIWSVPPLGGPARRIVDRGWGPGFSGDGTRIAYHLVFGGIWVCGADGSAKHQVAGFPAVTACSPEDGPAFSPDGKVLAALLTTPTGFPELWVAPADGGPGSRLTSENCEATNPVWTPDGNQIIFSSNRGGSLNLWRVDARGGTPEPLTTGAGDDGEPTVSPDGRRLVYTNVRNTYALMVLDIASGREWQVLERRNPIASPVFSPAGDKLALEVRTGGGSDLFVVDSGGGDLRPVGSEAGQFDFLPQWSADGESLYFFRGRPKGSLRKVSLAGGPSVELAPEWSAGMDLTAYVSPDGSRVAYSLEEERKPAATIVLELTTGAKTQLGMPLYAPRWSHDGCLLVGNTLDSPGFAICPAGGEPCTKFRVAGLGRFPQWSPDDTRVFFVVPGNRMDTAELRVVGRDGRGEKQVGELASIDLSYFTYEVSRQSKVSWVQVRPGRRELWLADLTR